MVTHNLFAVELPPIKSETGTGKVFTVDQSNGSLDKDEKDLKSRLNIEVSNHLCTYIECPISYYIYNMLPFCKLSIIMRVNQRKLLLKCKGHKDMVSLIKLQYLRNWWISASVSLQISASDITDISISLITDISIRHYRYQDRTLQISA